MFAPPEAHSSSICSDAQWLYSATLSGTSPTSPAPLGLQTAFYTEQNEMEWSLRPDVSFTGQEGDLYELDVEAMLPDFSNTMLHAFTVTIKLAYCG